MTVSNGPSGPVLLQHNPRFDLLRVPGLGKLLRWRWGRLVFQVPLLLLALLMIYDGLTGPQLAPQNISTVAAWVHYRGFVILALLLVGNLFCMACPFTLPRTVARKLSGRGRRWPRALRHKWMAILLLLALFWLYEWLDLWASPWLTAWLAIAYFVAAFVLEALFSGSPFCKYLCPLGTFNFVSSTVSPLQITARNREICRSCVGRECVSGSPQVLGCGTDLFVPQVNSNMDCIFCLDCARACPHDNVALASRPPLHELVCHAWPRRWDMAFLAFVFAFASVSNAFGMIPPVYELEARLAQWLGTSNEALILGLIFGVLNLLLPAVLGLTAAWLSRGLAKNDGEPLRVVFSRYAPALIPLAFAIWFAHYGFHFVTGALTIIPVAQGFLIDHGILLLGAEPNWLLGPVLPAEWLLPLQIIAVLIGFAGSLYVTTRLANRAGGSVAMARRAVLPWIVLLLGLALAAISVFSEPMEMRGTIELMALGV
ncbi:MAG: FesM [Chloroflexota bacterium]|nr:FesM [Chloroflexota bacterium]